MTKLLEKAFEAVRRLPAESQDEIAHAILNLAGDEGEPEDMIPRTLQMCSKVLPMPSVTTKRTSLPMPVASARAMILRAFDQLPAW